MDIEKRYAGRGEPVDHIHIDTLTANLDVLKFKSGEYAVWSPISGTVVSFHQTEGEAVMVAKKMLKIKD